MDEWATVRDVRLQLEQVRKACEARGKLFDDYFECVRTSSIRPDGTRRMSNEIDPSLTVPLFDGFSTTPTEAERAPLHVAPLVDTSATPHYERPPSNDDLAANKDDDAVKAWLREYLAEKVYKRPVVVYAGAVVRALDQVYSNGEQFDFARFRTANLTIGQTPTSWKQREQDIAHWTSNAHMTYRIERSSSSGAQPPDLRIVHALFQQQGFAQTSDPSSWHCLWLAPSVRLRLKQYRQLVPGQRVNRFPGGHLLASRWQWVPTSTRLAQVHGDKYALLPAMFRHPEQADAIHLYRQQHLDQYMTVELVDDNGDVVEGTASTIVQPGQPLPRLKRTQRAVITRYIDKHKLVLGRRMVEIVAMASVTSFDPLRVWLYNEAVVYLRAPVHIPASGVDYGFASADQKPRVWGLDDDTDVDPVPDASGRVHRSWTWLQGVLREAGHDHGAVWRRIRESVLQAVTGIQPDVKRLMRLCVHDRQTCYEMFQFNFVLDDRARPWLVRVSAPDLRCISPIQLAVYSGAVADSLNMIRMRPGQPVVPRTKWVTPPSRPKRISAALRRRRRSPSPIKRHANMATPSDMFDAQVETLSPEERDPMLQEMRDAILKEIDEENDRRGRFERLFPCTDASKYADMLSDLDGTLQQVVLTQLYWKTTKQATPDAGGVAVDRATCTTRRSTARTAIPRQDAKPKAREQHRTRTLDEIVYGAADADDE